MGSMCVPRTVLSPGITSVLTEMKEVDTSGRDLLASDQSGKKWQEVARS